MAVMAGLRSLLVFVSLSVSVSHGCSLYGICDIPCCDVTPSCSNARRVDCYCPGIDLITVTRGDVPPSVQEIYISAWHQVTIHSESLLDLGSLMILSINLNYKGALSVDENGLTFPNNANIRRVLIQNADIVTLATSAFGGFLGDSTEVELEFIKRLVIQHNSFNFRSQDTGPKIRIQYVEDLRLPPYSLSDAPIRELALFKVKMDTCLNGSLDGSISQIKLQKVKVNEVREGCMKAIRLNELFIVSSEIGIVRSRGIYGNLDKLHIRSTDFRKIEHEGLHLRVTTLMIQKCKFDELDLESLKVIGSESINFEDIIISKLRARGLGGLHLSSASGGSQETDIQQALSFNNMKLQHLDEGSLAFSEQTTIALNGYLKVPDPGESDCPMDKWLHRLVGKPQGSKLSDNDKTVFVKLRRSGHCAGSKALTTAAPAVRYESNESWDEPDDTTRAPHHTFTPSPEATALTESSEEAPTDGTLEKGSTTTPAGDDDQRSSWLAILGWVVALVLIAIAVISCVFKRKLCEMLGCI